LIWLFQQDSPATEGESQESLVAYEVVEAEFAEWDNIQEFLMHNRDRLITDTHNIAVKVPLSAQEMPYFIKMHKKLLITAIALSKN
jgi:hypothetical protein